MKLLFAFIFGYIIYKAIQLFSRVFFSPKNNHEDTSVHQTKNQSTKIDKKDVIDAQFEEIEVKENTNSNK